MSGTSRPATASAVRASRPKTQEEIQGEAVVGCSPQLVAQPVSVGPGLVGRGQAYAHASISVRGCGG
jgi:hypothetical protein